MYKLFAISFVTMLAGHLPAVYLPTVAQTYSSTQTDPKTQTPPSTQTDLSLNFRPPSGQGAPGGRARGGASRGNCPVTALPLLALVPLSESTSPEGDPSAAMAGLTSATHPTFWFYLPFALSAERTAEFSLLDAAGNYLYSTTLASSPSAGIVGIKLPNTVEPLAVDAAYSWMLQINCETANPIGVWGKLHRVALTPELARQVEQASPSEKAALYADHGIWYEALTTLAELHSAQPADPAILADWQSLLGSAGLAEVAEQPLLP